MLRSRGWKRYKTAGAKNDSLRSTVMPIDIAHILSGESWMWLKEIKNDKAVKSNHKR
jgi:hypothetical protein